jgi:hypothetical protein
MLTSLQDMAIDSSQLIALSFFFTVMALLVCWRSPTVSGQTLVVLRSLFPSWRFFEEVTEVPMLQYRTSADGLHFDDWKTALTRPVRRWHTIFVNPLGNLYLAYHSLLEYFEEELRLASVGSQPTDLVSYDLIAEVVRKSIQQSSSKGSRFQFRISRVFQGSPLEEAQEVFVSLPMEL